MTYLKKRIKIFHVRKTSIISNANQTKNAIKQMKNYVRIQLECLHEISRFYSTNSFFYSLRLELKGSSPACDSLLISRKPLRSCGKVIMESSTSSISFSSSVCKYILGPVRKLYYFFHRYSKVLQYKDLALYKKSKKLNF